MSIPRGGDVGLEMHDAVDQFLRIESGTAKVMMDTEKRLSEVWKADEGDAILIPSRTWHNMRRRCCGSYDSEGVLGSSGPWFQTRIAGASR